jgi:serine/threonine protein kinase
MNEPRYIALDRIATSRTFEVFDAWSLERGCRVVIKAVTPEKRGRGDAEQRLADEGRLLQRLTHPHIVRAYEVREEPPAMLVLETLPGETLAHLVDEGGGPLDGGEAALLGLQVGSALGYLHAHGMLHLDLKPSNIVVENGRAKLIDLSIARPPGRAEPGWGTWCYLAPEQALGGELTAAADVWGLGAVLYEALTGDIPFDDGSEDGYPQLSLIPPPVAGPLGPLVAWCLRRSPAERPPLEQVMEGLRGLAAAPRRPPVSAA